MRSWIAIATLMLTGWVSGSAALAQSGNTSRPVADDLGLFSAEAEAKANAVIGRVKQQHKKDLVIETAHAPKRPAGLNEKDKAAVGRFFDDWAVARFENQKVNGVYVVILEKPKIIRVVVGPRTLESGMFTKANRDELFQKIQEKLKASDEDGALLAGVNYVADTLQTNARTSSGATPQAAPPAKKTGGETTDDAAQPQVQASPIIKWILIGLAVLLVFWLVSAVIRALGSMGRAGGYGGAGGGGGFMSSLLGGLFGAAAGMWMYDHFFGGGTPSATAGPSGGYTPSEPTDVGAGAPSVGGGDYEKEEDGAADPGDWGSGDTGGGDFGGGGDWGGGGGDWGGGGGGDW